MSGADTTGQIKALTLDLDSLTQRSDQILANLETQKNETIAALKKLRQRRIRSIPAGARRVLVVDDDKAFLRVMRRMLREIADLVDVAPSVRAARQMIDEVPYDAILVDYTLVNGLASDVIASIRRRPNRRHAWIILMSGHWPKDKGMQAAAQLGANDYVEKPVTSIEDLERQVLRAFKGKPELDRPFHPTIGRRKS